MRTGCLPWNYLTHFDLSHFNSTLSDWVLSACSRSVDLAILVLRLLTPRLTKVAGGGNIILVGELVSMGITSPWFLDRFSNSLVSRIIVGISTGGSIIGRSLLIFAVFPLLIIVLFIVVLIVLGLLLFIVRNI